MKNEKGWYAPNTYIIPQIIPELRYSGGGVCKSELVATRKQALEKCIFYTKQIIADAESHLKLLKRDLENEN